MVLIYPVKVVRRRTSYEATLSDGEVICPHTLIELREICSNDRN